MLYSKINGYNNDSGLLYKTYNGLGQYRLKENLYPSYSNPQAKYINERNEEVLLETMNDDGTDFVNKDGNSRIKDLSNMDLQDGGFKNKGNVESQTSSKGINKLVITKEAKSLSRRNIIKLPTEKSQPTRGSQDVMNKFQTFLNSLEGKKDKFSNNKPRTKVKSKSRKETKYEKFAKNYQKTNNDIVPPFDMI